MRGEAADDGVAHDDDVPGARSGSGLRSLVARTLRGGGWAFGLSGLGKGRLDLTVS